MNSDGSAEVDRTAILSPANRLAECEKGLAMIATDVTELVGELSRLHAGGDDLARLLEERNESVDRSALSLAQLRAERDQLLERADTASDALRIAEARLAELNEHVETLARENQALRAERDKREVRVAGAESELRRLQEVLDERDRALEQVRSTAHRAEHEADRWWRRSANLLLELADATTAGVRPPREHEPASSMADTVAGPPVPSLGHIRLLAHPDGYRLSSSHDPCPRAGDRIVIDGAEHVVIRLGPSPLPNDDRPCAFLSLG